MLINMSEGIFFLMVSLSWKNVLGFFGDWNIAWNSENFNLLSIELTKWFHSWNNFFSNKGKGTKVIFLEA